MIRETFGTVIVISGLIMLLLAFLLLKRDFKAWLNRLLALGFILIGCSVSLDGLAILLHDSTLFELFQYFLAFTIPIGAGTLFLASITLVRGEDYSKSTRILLPTALLATLPGILILILQSNEVNIVTIGDQELLLSSFGIGAFPFLAALLILLLGSLTYFYITYKDCTGIVRKQMQYFTVGMALIILLISVTRMIAVFTEESLLDVLAVVIMGPAIVLGSIFVSYGFLKDFK